MKSIGIDNVFLFHAKIAEMTGGDKKVRDASLIDAAIKRAFATFDSNDLYPALEDKVAAISHGLIKNHGFMDGNKRTGVCMMLLLAKMNGINLNYTQAELVDLGLGTAEGRYDERYIREWICRHKKV